MRVKEICCETLRVVVTAVTLPATATTKVYAPLHLVAEFEFIQLDEVHDLMER